MSLLVRHSGHLYMFQDMRQSLVSEPYGGVNGSLPWHNDGLGSSLWQTLYQGHQNRCRNSTR
jgi:hypothetical protein